MEKLDDKSLLLIPSTYRTFGEEEEVMRRDESGELVVYDTMSFLSDSYTKSESAHGQNDDKGADGAEKGGDKEEEEGGRKGSWKSYRSQLSKGPA